MGVFYFYLALVMGFLPYRQILRSEFLHLSLLEVVKGALVLAYAIKNLHLSTVNRRNRLWLPNRLNPVFWLVIATYLFSTLLGLARQPVSGWNHVFRLGANVVEYLLFFILMKEISTEDRLWRFTRVLLLYALVSAVFVAVFQVYPELLPETSEMGTQQMSYGAFRRIFTPGGWLIFAASVAIAGYLLWIRSGGKRHDAWLVPFLVVMLLAQIPSLIRSNFVIITFWIAALLVRRLASVRASVSAVAKVALVLGLLVVGAGMIRTPGGDTLGSALAQRLFSVEAVARGEELNTVQARLLEAGMAAQEIQTWKDHVFGLGFGHTFFFSLLPDEYEASVTHNGYFSIYYSQGAVGAMCLLVFLLAVSRRIVSNYLVLLHSPWRRLQAGLMMVWFSYLVANWQASVFQLPETIVIIVATIVISEKLRYFYAPREADALA